MSRAKIRSYVTKQKVNTLGALQRIMSNFSPLMIAVAPNGARKTQVDHPALPLSPPEIATTATNCLNAGACMIHLHVRDENYNHSLDPERYKKAIAAIRSKVGENLIVQITTEAVGIYKPEEQVEVVKAVRPEAASIALRELCPNQKYEKQAGLFFEWMYKNGVSPQYILYDKNDIRRFNHYRQTGLIPGDNVSILLVLGRYSLDQQSDPNNLYPLLEDIDPNHKWWLCAFGKTESKCMNEAIKLNGHCRVGFENNTILPNGDTAVSNHQLVQEVAKQARALNRPIADADNARELMGIK